MFANSRMDAAPRGAPDGGAFGDRMGRYLHLDSAPSLSTRSFRTGQLVVTRLANNVSHPRMSECIPAEDSFICELHLADLPRHEIWNGDRMVLRRAYARGSISILDLRKEVRTLAASAFDTLNFYLPKSVLDEFADDVGASRIDRLECEPGVCDEVLEQLGGALLPALERPGEASELFFDHLALAINSHILLRYGGLRALRSVPVGGLAPWRARRATELLASRLQGDISVAEVAEACGLSRTYFIKAFRHTTGVTPHKWLQNHKVDRAKQLLVGSSSPIADIALACGFADQSHLTRTFTRLVGTAPAMWRRLCKGVAPRDVSLN